MESRFLKEWLRRAINFPQYGPAGLRDPQEFVEVWLQGPSGSVEVTRNNVVAALRPFTIGIMLGHDYPEGFDGESLRLCMYDCLAGRRFLGEIHLRLVRLVNLPEHRFYLFETDGSRNSCVGALSLFVYHVLERWRAGLRRRKNPYNFRMTPEDLRCSHVFYLCPRPVELVSVEYEGVSNMFPMDLIGPTDSPWFSMALRSTSPAVRLMKQSRKLALASVPISYRAVAYEMARHHHRAGIDWSTLPFRTVLSPLFGLRVIEAALKVREVVIEQFHDVGSHVLFLTSIKLETCSKETLNGGEGLQLFHSFSSYRQYLDRRAALSSQIRVASD